MEMRSTRFFARSVATFLSVSNRADEQRAARQNIAPATTFALLTELIHRDGLPIALANRHDLSLEPVLKFLVKHVVDPRYCTVAVDTAKVLIGTSLSLSIPDGRLLTRLCE